jgi:hypothetical protein
LDQRKWHQGSKEEEDEEEEDDDEEEDDEWMRWAGTLSASRGGRWALKTIEDRPPHAVGALQAEGGPEAAMHR